MTDFVSPVVDPPDLEEGMEFASGATYKLISRLGRGGMGEVWKALRTSAAGHQQVVAIKYLTNPSSSRNALDAEALKMSLLSHDNIVPFVDSGVDKDGRYFIAMSFVEGCDLDGFRKIVGMSNEAAYKRELRSRIPDRVVGFIIFMTLRALDYAHTFRFNETTVGRRGSPIRSP